MRDQAYQLRRLVRQSARHSRSAGPVPRFVLVVSGKSGDGATTVAVNLAIAMARQAARVALVDACGTGRTAAAMCGLQVTCGLADVLQGGRDIHEVLHRGPGGLQIAPAAGPDSLPAELNSLDVQRLIGELQSLGRHVEWTVIDAGTAGSAAARLLWEASDEVVVVVRPQHASIIDAYAALKAIRPADHPAPFHLLVNCAVPADAADVHHRFDRSCRRFLETTARLLGSLRPLTRPGAPLLGSVFAEPSFNDFEGSAEFDRIAQGLMALPRAAAA